MRRLLLAGLLAAWSPGIAAQPALPEGPFCLRHVATDQMVRDCLAFQPPGTLDAAALCRNEAGERIELTVTEAWSAVGAGAPDCPARAPGRRSTEEVPRSDEGEED